MNKGNRHASAVYCLILFVGAIVCAPFFAPRHCLAAEAVSETVITSDALEIYSETKKYIATGSVRVEKEDEVTEAERITYEELSSWMTAEGNVRYQSREAS